MRSVSAHLKTRYGLDIPVAAEQPKQPEFGELALPVAFQLARELRKPPRAIAAELAAELPQVEGIAKLEVAGNGYINVRFDRGAYGRALMAPAAGKETAGGEKIIVEHTNVNPNKAAHIGHLRNAVLGDTFVRMLRASGQTVEVQNYIDNTGVQVADVVVGFHYLEKKSLVEVRALIEDPTVRFDYLCWDLYARVSAYYHGNAEALKWRQQTLHAIEQGEGELAELAHLVSNAIVECHLKTMLRLGIEYDVLPRESEILHLHFWEKAFELLKQAGAVYFVEQGKNQGCWVMSTSKRADASGAERDELEDEEKIIVRSDQTVTYVGKDIAYQLWKFGLLGLDFQYRPYQGPDGRWLWITATEAAAGTAPPRFGAARRVYNVIDARQAYLQGVVLQGLQALGFEQEARNSIHFSYEMVALSPSCCQEMGIQLSQEDSKRPYIEVSGRKGLGVKADDLLDMLMEKALAEVRARHTIPEQDASSIARTIAVGALRYFLLRFARNTVIAFDFKEALSFDGETGPYVQYAVVRANNIFRKVEESGGQQLLDEDVDRSSLHDFLAGRDDIWELVYLGARLPEVVRQVAQSLELSQLGKYAFYLAQKFNLFYHKYHILSEVDPERKRNLLLVVDVVRRQLEKALDLLGCEVPPRM